MLRGKYNNFLSYILINIPEIIESYSLHSNLEVIQGILESQSILNFTKFIQ
jgi:hypothetical protein